MAEKDEIRIDREDPKEVMKKLQNQPDEIKRVIIKKKGGEEDKK